MAASEIRKNYFVVSLTEREVSLDEGTGGTGWRASVPSRKYAGCGFDPFAARPAQLWRSSFQRKGGSNPFGASPNGPIAALREAREPTRIEGLARLALDPFGLVLSPRISGTGH